MNPRYAGDCVLAVLLSLATSACTTVRYASVLDNQQVVLNEGTTDLGFSGFGHRFELVDQSGTVCATALTAFGAFVAQSGADAEAARTGRAATRTYTVHDPRSFSGLECGMSVGQVQRSGFDVRRHGGHEQLRLVTPDTFIRATEFGLVLRGDFYGKGGLGGGFDLGPTFGGIVAGEEGENFSGSYARWPIEARLHLMPSWLFGLGLTGHAAFEVLTLRPEYGASLGFRAVFAKTGIFSINVGWRRQNGYAWHGDERGTLSREGAFAQIGLGYVGLMEGGK